jgi:hypothetical protein
MRLLATFVASCAALAVNADVVSVDANGAVEPVRERRSPPPLVEKWVESNEPASQAALDAAAKMMEKMEQDTIDQQKVVEIQPLLDSMSDEEQARFLTMGKDEQQAHLSALRAAAAEEEAAKEPAAGEAKVNATASGPGPCARLETVDEFNVAVEDPSSMVIGFFDDAEGAEQQHCIEAFCLRAATPQSLALGTRYYLGGNEIKEAFDMTSPAMALLKPPGDKLAVGMTLTTDLGSRGVLKVPLSYPCKAHSMRGVAGYAAPCPLLNDADDLIARLQNDPRPLFLGFVSNWTADGMDAPSPAELEEYSSLAAKRESILCTRARDHPDVQFAIASTNLTQEFGCG